MQGIIIGAGEVGRGLHEVLKDTHETRLADLGATKNEGERVEIMHICFPYSNEFIASVIAYAEEFEPDYIVIHSTVRPGTTRSIQNRLSHCLVIHAPVEGRHPDLASSIRAWVKPIGFCESSSPVEASKVLSYFADVGIQTWAFKNPESTELGKILSTTKLGMDVIFARMADRICKEWGVDYDEAVRQYTEGYNELYQSLYCDFYTRPILYPSEEPIGGHCVKPNLELVDHDQMRDIKQFILEHESYGTERFVHKADETST